MLHLLNPLTYFRAWWRLVEILAADSRDTMPGDR